MAEPSKDTDQSMEDILQSIKRIIADEGEPSPTMAGSDVLELTDLLAEDTAIADPESSSDETIAPPMSIDDIMAAPISSGAVDVAPVVAPTPVVEVPPAAKVETPTPVKPEPAPVISAPTGDTLMSDSTLSASLAALNALSTTPAAPTIVPQALNFRSGITVEDLVVEALKPLLKEWLDGNLPSLVTSLVEKEIRRLSAAH